MKKLYEKLSDIFYVTKSEIRLTATIFGIVLLGYGISVLTSNYDVGEQNFQQLLDSLQHVDSLKKVTSIRIESEQSQEGFEPNPIEVDSKGKIRSIQSLESEIGNSTENQDQNLGKYQTYNKKELPSHLVDINKASKRRLMELPGIGEKTAEIIIQYRKMDTFRRIEDIQNVKGIGPKKFEKMKPFITVKKKQ